MIGCTKNWKIWTFYSINNKWCEGHVYLYKLKGKSSAYAGYLRMHFIDYGIISESNDVKQIPKGHELANMKPAALMCGLYGVLDFFFLINYSRNFKLFTKKIYTEQLQRKHY